MKLQYTYFNPGIYQIFPDFNEFFKYTNGEITSFTEVIFQEDFLNANKLYFILILNKKHAFLGEMIERTYIDSKIISYLGENITEDQIKEILSGVKLFE